MMQAITNDEKYKPGVDMIADNRNLKQRIDALESETKHSKRTLTSTGGFITACLTCTTRWKRST